MRVSRLVPFVSTLIAATPLLALAQDAGAPKPPPSLLTPSGGLMVWTLAIFVLMFLILNKYAFGPITKQVREREQALSDALAQAKKDREEAAALLANQREQLDAARAEGQKLITQARVTAEAGRQDVVVAAQQQSREIIDRARDEIRLERDKAVAELRREAVDLAILGASKVIEKNLDDSTNRDLVEKFLVSVGTTDRAKG
jgi:F-type H+-transporting ATPase subunit b